MKGREDVYKRQVSALTGDGIDKLLETVLLVAEMKELRANPCLLYTSRCV